jgi:carboxyl-terminal processing protease
MFACLLAPSLLAGDKLAELATVMNYVKSSYIESLDDSVIADKAIKGLLSQLDPHSDYLDTSSYKTLKEDTDGSFVGIGMEVTLDKGFLKVISPIDGSPAQKAGLEPGDYITHVDDVLVTDLSYADAIARIKGKKGTQVKLTLARKNQPDPIVVSITRDTIDLVVVKSKMLTSDIGYLKIATFTASLEQEIIKATAALKKQANPSLRGFVVDLRNNPGGLLSSGVEATNLFLNADKLTDDKLIVRAKERNQRDDLRYTANGPDILNNIPMVVLINHGSASSSEIFALALQDYQRAIIMGEQSFGKGSIQSVIPVGDSNAIKITTGLYYSPKGRVIQGHGVKPDVEVPAVSIKKQSDAFSISESSYPNALQLPKKSAPSSQKRDPRYDDFLENLQVLHDSDFQVYQAVLMLESLRQFEP